VEGILQELSGELVRVDSKWYKVLQPQYVPKEMGIKVSFSTDESDPGTIKFIKAFVAGEGKPAAKPYVKKTYGKPAGEVAPTTVVGKTAPEDVRNTSIVRQVIFKGAVELVNGGHYATIDLALVDLKKLEVYLLGK